MTDRALHIDFETRSAVDLKSAGAYRYAEDPTTGIWCMAWSLGGSDRGIWRPEDFFPQKIIDHIYAGGRVVAHNAVFERLMWNGPLGKLLHRRVFLPPLFARNMDCTVARCAALAIPSSLGDAGYVLGVTQQKDKEGHANMLVLARPKTLDPLVWNDTPERLAKQYAYCAQDVLAEEAIDAKAPPLSPRERAVWLLDQKINDLGIQLDIPLIEAARQVVEAEKARLDRAITNATNGAVTAISQVGRLTAWLVARGHAVPGLGKEHIRAVQKAIADDPDAAEALAIRLEGAKASTAKLKAMLACVCGDGRARGLLAYHGAHPGRWAGRLIQPQNLYRNDPERDGDDIKHTLPILSAVAESRMAPTSAARAIRLLTGSSAMTMLAKCLRPMFRARPGHRLVGGDLSNIEGRIAAWISDEKWKVQAFRDYDAGVGPDLYRLAFARSFGGEPSAVTGMQRQVGKVTELSLQYQGSVGAWLKMAANYGVTAASVVDVVRAAVGPDLWRAMLDSYAAATDKHRLPQDQWAAVKLIVKSWREAHPHIVQGWWDLQDAAIAAVSSPGAIVPVYGGRVRYLASRGFLWCALPSGRTLAYFQPKIVVGDTSYLDMPDGTRKRIESMSDADIAAAEAEGALMVRQSRRRVDYQGYEGERKRWATMSLYGGMQFNHVVQGTARDIMVEGMLEADRRGYPLVLTVHDELLAECKDGFGSPAELEEIMSTVPPWIVGDLPLAAKAWEDVRYAK